MSHQHMCAEPPSLPSPSWPCPRLASFAYEPRSVPRPHPGRHPGFLIALNSGSSGAPPSHNERRRSSSSSISSSSSSRSTPVTRRALPCPALPSALPLSLLTRVRACSFSCCRPAVALTHLCGSCATQYGVVVCVSVCVFGTQILTSHLSHTVITALWLYLAHSAAKLASSRDTPTPSLVAIVSFCPWPATRALLLWLDTCAAAIERADPQPCVSKLDSASLLALP